MLMGLVLLAGLTLLRIQDPPAVQDMRLAYFDRLQRLFPRDYIDLPIRVIDIDERSLAEIGQWPWPRDRMAELLRRVQGAGAVVVAFDVLFAEPDRTSPTRLLANPELSPLMGPDLRQGLLDRDTDAAFAQALQTAPSVLGVAAGNAETPPEMDKAGVVQIGNAPLSGTLRMPGLTPLLPELGSAAAGLGNINVSPSSGTGIVRRVPLMWQSDQGFVPSLSAEALRVALGETTYVARGLGTLSGAMESLGIGGYLVPTTGQGEFWVHYRPDDARLYVSAADVFAPGGMEALRPLLNGNIVLVGTSAAGLRDIRTTALGDSVPGVSIHAQILEQILTERYLFRSEAVDGAELVILLLLGVLLTVVMSLFGPLPALLSGLTAMGAAVGGSLWAFANRGLLFDAAYPVLAGFMMLALLTAYRFVVTDKEKRLIRRSFAQYLAPTVLNEIERRGYDIALGGEERDVTLMFADLRNFTPLSERLQPEPLVALLNDLFTELSHEIHATEGTIDKFIGDSIMAFWNAPLEIPDYPRAAALAALGLQDAISRFVKDRGVDPPLELAVGLSTGPALVGNIGSAERFDYSALGDTVNIAARIEAACRYVGVSILADEATHMAAPDLAWLPAGRVDLKGKSERQAVYGLFGDAALAQSTEFQTLRQVAEDAMDARVPLSRLREQLKDTPRFAEFCLRLEGREADFAPLTLEN